MTLKLAPVAGAAMGLASVLRVFIEGEVKIITLTVAIKSNGFIESSLSVNCYRLTRVKVRNSDFNGNLFAHLGLDLGFVKK